MLLSSNWDVDDNLDIANLLQEYTSKLSDELAELLEEEKCFILNKNNQQNICCIQIMCPDLLNLSDKNQPTDSYSSRGKYVDTITILSEAKHIEVFVGKYEEYFGTFTSNVVDQFGDASLCRTDISIAKPYSSIKLSLKNTFEDSSIMIFGLFAKVKYIDAKNQLNATRFTSNHLDNIFVDHPVKLSKNAEFFKQALQNYNDTAKDSAKGNGMPLSVLPFLSVMSETGKSTKQEQNPSTDETLIPKVENQSVCALTEQIDSLKAGLDIGKVMETLKINSVSELKSIPQLEEIHRSNEVSLDKIIGGVLDKKFAEFEKKLMDQVDEKLSVYSNTILSKLNDIENKISP